MSFDTEFNFTPIIEGATARINAIQSRKTLNETKVALLSATPYVSLLTTEIDQLNNEVANITSEILGYQAIIDEIMRITALSNEEKSLIYYFYTVLSIPKNKYITKLLFNTTALVNPNVLAVYNDTVTDPPTKLLVAQMLYDQFAINTTYREIYSIGSFIV